MADTVKVNLDGIARIERFLDRIEDCDESITQEFQTQFEEQFNLTSDENFNDEGSEEYRENLKILSLWQKEGELSTRSCHSHFLSFHFSYHFSVNCA